MLVVSQPWSRHADSPVIMAGEDEIEDVHYAVAIGITGTPGFNKLPVTTRDSGHVENIDYVIPVGISRADERQQGKKETNHGCHLLGCPGRAGTLRGRHLAPRKEQERRTCIAYPSTFPREAA